ncbi:MAG: hypothetical protein IJV40_11020 [Oscillospiraceae bacterium]|nr:hypothetical protein [Oscillospiraceae bacterium]
MREWIITGVLIVAAFITIAVYACIIAASKADRREEEERECYHERH